MKVSKITIGRLYNLGNYEHVRYELTVDVGEGESAAEAVIGLEKIMDGLKPLKSTCTLDEQELERKKAEIERMRTMPAVEWERQYGHCSGTPSEVIERYQKGYEEAKEKRSSVVAVAKEARRLFDDLGGAAEWKDAKLDWDYDDGLAS